MNSPLPHFTTPLLKDLAKAIQLDKRRKALRLLQQVDDVNQVGRDGMTLLMWAYQHGRPNLFRLIALKGADPTLPTNNGATVAHLAAQDDDPTYAQALAEAAANPHASVSCDGHLV